MNSSISKEDDEQGNRTAEVRGADDDVQNAIAAIQERFCTPGGGGGRGGVGLFFFIKHGD